MGDLLLDPSDEFSRVLTLAEAAACVGVTTRTINRWIASEQLRVLPGRRVVEREVRDCEAARHAAAHQGRPGARPGVADLTA